jgi:hypothetical protein
VSSIRPRAGRGVLAFERSLGREPAEPVAPPEPRPEAGDYDTDGPAVRARVKGAVGMAGHSARPDGAEGAEGEGAANFLKYSPDFALTERRAPAADFARAAGRGEGDGEGEPDLFDERSAPPCPGKRDETCPISTAGGTRRVRLIRQEGRDVSS